MYRPTLLKSTRLEMARYTPKSRFSGISRHGLGCNCPAISQASSPRLLMPKLNATRGFGYSMITALPGGFLPPAGTRDRKCGVEGKRVSIRVALGDRRIIKKKKEPK